MPVPCLDPLQGTANTGSVSPQPAAGGRRYQGGNAVLRTPTTSSPSPLWTQRHHHEDYLAWRTARGFTDTFEAMLTEPLVINYYDEVFYSPGIAASPSMRPPGRSRRSGYPARHLRLGERRPRTSGIGGLV